MIPLPLFILLIFSLLIHLPAYAITFDIWQTGMVRQEVFAAAQSRDLPLARDGMFHSNKKYNPKLLAGDATRYYYFTSLFDHSAKVMLHLSPAKGNYGQFLYEVEVLFTDPGKTRDLFPYVTRMLTDKYGSPRQVNNIIQQQLVWHPKKDGEIRLIRSGVSLQLKYTDLKIQEFAKELAKSTFELPRNPGVHQDAGKF